MGQGWVRFEAWSGVSEYVLCFDLEEVDGEGVQILDRYRRRVGGRLHGPVPLAIFTFPETRKECLSIFFFSWMGLPYSVNRWLDYFSTLGHL